MNGKTDRRAAPRWQDAATIAALLNCYDVWSATPQRDCTAELLHGIAPESTR